MRLTASLRGGFFYYNANMKIVIVTKKPVLTTYGRLPKDNPVDVPDQLAKFLIERGDAMAYEVKVAQDRPSMAAGTMESSSASPVALASTQMTSSESESGERPKRRGRPPKALSSSTPHSE